MSGSPGLLVVCTANVCRSPTTALLLQRRLAERGADVAVRLRTAGTDADPGSGFCPVAADLLGPGADGLLVAHASHLITRRDLDDAALVLVMERAHRAAVVALDPGAGLRTFTLREAAVLAGAVPRSAGQDLSGLVRAMHAARGSTAPGEHPRPLADRLHRVPAVDPLDVPDAHVRRRTSHAQVLDLLRAGVDGWVDGWVGTGPTRG